MRILALDVSLGCPGAAVIEVKRGKAKVIAVSHCKTDSKEPYAVRTKHIESWLHMFMRQNGPYNIVVRESLNHRIPKIQYAIFSAWNATDRALNDFGLRVDEMLTASAIKKHVAGKGKAEKSEVEAGVRKLTGYKGEFATDDESDACAIALAYLLEKKLISKGVD